MVTAVPPGATPPAQDKTLLAEETPELVPDMQTLTQEATRVLRRLCETGALLAVAAEMDKAVVVRDAGSTAEAIIVKGLEDGDLPA